MGNLLNKLSRLNSELNSRGLSVHFIAAPSEEDYETIVKHTQAMLDELGKNSDRYDLNYSDLEGARFMADLDVGDTVYVLNSREGLYNNEATVRNAKVFRSAELGNIYLDINNHDAQNEKTELSNYSVDKFGKLIFPDEKSAEIALEKFPVFGSELYLQELDGAQVNEIVVDVSYSNNSQDIVISACSPRDFDEYWELKGRGKDINISLHKYLAGDIGERIFLSEKDLCRRITLNEERVI